MDTIEENKLISEFLEAKLIDNEFRFPCIMFKEGKNFFTELELKFHYDWNWLMPVVSKIHSICDGCDGDFRRSLDHYRENVCEITIFDISIFSDKKTIYSTCVKFINWYNQQK